MKARILGMLVATLLAVPPTSIAATWHWSFNGGAYGGTGTFTTTDEGAFQLVTGITGTTAGMAITDLVAPGGFESNDNRLTLEYPQLTTGGIAFSTDDFVARLFWNAAASSYRFAIDDGRSNVVGFEALPDNLPVAEPGSLALLGLGLAGLVLGHRRKGA